jgi:predicted cobalt transporter CbtA
MWHGLFLNDLEKVSYSLPLYFSLAGLVYICIGFIVLMLATKVEVSSKKYANGVLFGGVLGFFFYLVAFVLGISFTDGNEISHLAIDFMWQMIETGIGGFVAGALYTHYKEMAKIADANSDI